MKKTGKLATLSLAALMAISLGATAVFAASDDTADTSANVSADISAADTAATAVDAAATASGDTATADTSATKSGRTKSAAKSGRRKIGTRVSATSIAASVLGVTDDEVKESVKTGKVGDLLIAADKVDAFKSEYLSQTQAKLSAAVTAGTLTQAQSDEKYAEVKAKMDAYDGTTHLCGKSDHSEMSAGKTKSAD